MRLTDLDRFRIDFYEKIQSHPVSLNIVINPQ